MTKRTNLFGTDGIRQEVGKFPLDNASILKLGCALGDLCRGAKILIGRDTRESGQHIETLLAAGISGICAGEKPGEITGCGVIPTPGLSLLTERGDFDYGVMITASHNPYTDNGIKIFSANGEKIPEAMEKQLEEIFSRLETPRDLPPLSLQYSGLQEIYFDFLCSHTPGLKPGKLKLVLDCANGATYRAAPLVFREAGFDPTVLHAEPNGRNINRNCGSTSLESLKETMLTRQADLGIAFDGDGDRVLFLDGNGRTLNGDYALYLLARFFLHTMSSEEFNKIVVGTVMGNLGLEKALQEMGVTYLRTPVGDKYVYREMKLQQSILGGEASGHTILRRFQKTGDGILTALYFLKAIEYLGIHPAEIFQQLTLYPQAIKNIPIRERKDLGRWDILNEGIAAFNDRFGANSRLLIRYSGTEPKIRIMIESEQQAIIDENIGKFTELIQSAIGA